MKQNGRLVSERMVQGLDSKLGWFLFCKKYFVVYVVIVEMAENLGVTVKVVIFYYGNRRPKETTFKIQISP